jgi:hypothetical protein
LVESGRKSLFARGLPGCGLRSHGSARYRSRLGSGGRGNGSGHGDDRCRSWCGLHLRRRRRHGCRSRNRNVCNGLRGHGSGDDDRRYDQIVILVQQLVVITDEVVADSAISHTSRHLPYPAVVSAFPDMPE